MIRRNVGILCLLLAAAASTAHGQMRRLAPGDVYCSGMFTREAIPNDLYMVSGEESNYQTIYAQGDYIYINRGSAGGVKVGDQFSVMRKVKTPSHWKWFSTQPTLLKAMGDQWADLGRVRVVHVEGNTAVALVTMACGYLQRGDVVRPFAERPTPALRAWDGNRWPAPTGKAQGMVVMSREFEQVDGMDDVIYINVGSAQGAKVGDYVRVFRYQGTRHETAYQTRNTQYAMWEFGKTPVPYKWNDLPREYLAEGVILRASENASTVFISQSLKQFYHGDYVELDNPAPPVVEAPPAPVAAPNRPPSLTCSAERASVMAGDSVRVMARGSDPDGDPLVYSWYANAGRITPQGESATWSSAGLGPGRYTINAQANDGKNAAADCATYIEVAAPAAPPQASKISECGFASGSSRVDNVCKRFLDDAAVRLKNDPTGRVVLVGYSDPEEAGAARVGGSRAENARTYLQASGIATGRVEVRPASGQAGAGAQNRRVDIVWVPGGASY